jgi:hypothetical protein
VKSIHLGNRDLLRDGLLVSSSAGPDTLDGVLGTNAGKLSGQVVDRFNRPAAGAQITLIPDPSSGRLQQYASGAVAGDGSYSLSGLAPGHYLVLAAPGDPPCDIYNPAELGPCRKIALPLDVASSSQANLPLQMP